ncbi:MAG TPA: MFS transporter [Sphingomonas sanguinis]|uniref:MFS transporter n=1 Tax=Sphingomonas sanguinis TaxID=33051 RepID=UPI002ABEC03C|nr:MFS transporter [Sphingomonas sanguinis]
MIDPPHTPKGSPLILGAVCLAALTLPLSFSAGAVATPAIGRDLGGSAEALTWITNAFMLTFGSLLMAAGTLADRYGRKRVFTIGVATFTGFSLALGLAPSVWLIDLLRAGQGIGAAAALAGGSAALAQEFDGHARTRAFGLLGTTFGVGLAFGPVLTGLLIESVGWRAIFLTSTIVGAAALLLGPPRMHETRDPGASRLDWPGAASFTAMLTVFTVAMIESPAIGWTSPAMLALVAAFVVLLTAFAVIELRTARPMLDLSLFRYRRFVGVQLLPIATCACFVVLLVILPLRFIGIEGRSEIEAGFLMLALSAPMLVVPLVAATLARRVSPGVISGIGLLVAAAGLAWLGTMDVGTGRSVIAPMLLIGIGSGLPWGLMDGLSVSVVPKERAGMATGIFGTVRVAGEGVALAIVSAALAALIAAALHGVPGLSRTVLAQAGQRLAVGDAAGATDLSAQLDGTTLLHAYQTAFATLSWVLAGITTACAIAVFALLGRQERLDAIGASTDAGSVAA